MAQGADGNEVMLKVIDNALIDGYSYAIQHAELAIKAGEDPIALMKEELAKMIADHNGGICVPVIVVDDNGKPLDGKPVEE